VGKVTDLDLNSFSQLIDYRMEFVQCRAARVWKIPRDHAKGNYY
jgi:hypothetical protein